MSPSVAALVAILATLSAAQTAPSCTTTLTPGGITCCPSVGHTATSYIDCNGCALTTADSPQCKMKCSVPFPTSNDLTTTLTSCVPSITSSMSTYIKRDDGPVNTIDDPIETCTITALTKTLGACGDCDMTYETTKTKSMECGGCALLTVEITMDGAGVCVYPTAKETTVTACKTGRSNPAISSSAD